MKRLTTLLLLISFVLTLSAQKQLKREMRAVWIATVANINWPSKKNLSTQEQKNEAIKLLDLLEDANFNAVIF